MLRNKKVIIGVLSVACVVSLASVGYLRYIRTRGEALEEQCKLALEANEWAKLEEVAYEWAQLEPDKALPWIYAAEGANNQSKPIQTGVYLSMLPDNAKRPSGSRLTQFTSSVCPPNVRTHCASSRSHSRSAASAPHDTACLLSRATAIALTGPECSINRASSQYPAGDFFGKTRYSRAHSRIASGPRR